MITNQSSGPLPAQGCLAGLLRVYLIGFFAFWQIVAGLFVFGFTSTNRKAREADAAITQHRVITNGEVTGVEKREETSGGEGGPSIAYLTSYRYTLPDGQKFAGELEQASEPDFHTGQTVCLKYDSRDPMVKRLQGQPIANAGAGWGIVLTLFFVLVIPCGVALANYRRLMVTLPQRLGKVLALLFCSLCGYILGSVLFGGGEASSSYSTTSGHRYTFQIDDKVSEGAGFSSAGISLSNDRLVVQGKTYPMPPNHAHIWLKQGRLHINNMLQP